MNSLKNLCLAFVAVASFTAAAEEATLNLPVQKVTTQARRAFIDEPGGEAKAGAEKVRAQLRTRLELVQGVSLDAPELPRR